ncbi:MAG: DUF4920 domain-containing protein [Phycisphaerae bacterium]|nr:DUF4920 domain-containing protein [Phycisphaerae bacterium]
MRQILLATLSLTSCCLLMQGCCKILGACMSPDQSPQASQHDNWSHYGNEVDAHAVPQVAMGALGDAKGQVKVEGTITEVCAIKGCWMKVTSGDASPMLVRFKDYGFFVPRNAAGRQVWMTGTAERVELSIEALRHLAEDGGKSPAEIAAITKPEVQVTFMADAVWVQGPGLQDPYRPIGQEKCDPVDSGTTPVK